MQIKLNVLKEAVKGKRVIMIDDSIVREEQQVTVHCEDVTRCRSDRSSRKDQFPTIPLWLCYFGTDIPEREEQLIAYNRSINEICEVIGADSLGYLGEERLLQMA